MPTSSTGADTRTATRRGGVLQPHEGRWLLAPGTVLTSVESGLRYRIDRPLGAGGFGQVFLATCLRASDVVPATVCIKISRRQDGWLREAYFGLLLNGHSRAIAVYDAFPSVESGAGLLYCLALEYATHGDLRDYLLRHGAWKERAVRREITGVLQVLDKLHRGQLLHRDLTPMNVFVCEGPRLKLGDFGIVRQQSDRRGVTARTLNPLLAPSDIFDGAAPKWQARDDVYQVGQLIGMLVKGDASRRLRPADVRLLSCSDQLKEVVYRCIGERRKRYLSADALIQALAVAPVAIPVARVRSLKGLRVAFTGFLTVPRADAAAAATRVGALVQSGTSAKTDVVVRGRPNALQAAGRDGGRKLLDLKRLREKGVRIALLSEAHFWRLVGRPGRAPVKRDRS